MFFNGQFIPFLPSSVALLSIVGFALTLVIGITLSRWLGEKCFAATCFICLAILTFGGVYSMQFQGLKGVTPQQISVAATHLSPEELAMLKREVSRYTDNPYTLIQLEGFLKGIKDVRDNPPVADANKELLQTLDSLREAS